jgi:Fe-S cluster biogenesis protein NfuA
MKEQIEEAIKKIRPMLQADGGDVEFVDVEDGVVKVRLQGACAGCPMSQMTVKNGIERLLKQEIPEVKSVESVMQTILAGSAWIGKISINNRSSAFKVQDSEFNFEP